MCYHFAFMKHPGAHATSGLIGALLLSFLAGCGPAQPPAHWEFLDLSGSAYEQGRVQGERFSSRMRSLHTQLLTTSILPYLNRERPSIAEMLWTYQDPKYDDGRFSTLLFEESAQNLWNFIPAEYQEEFQGLADGSGMPLEQVLVLNTFMDTLMAFRAITYFIRDQSSPHLTEIEFSLAGQDGADNDGDGETDEPGEGTLAFEPDPWVNFVEVPPETELSLCLSDPDGVNPALVRIQTADGSFRPGDPGLSTGACGAQGQDLRVTLHPPGGFPEAAYVSVIVSAGDMRVIEDPPPPKANMAREVRFGFTTRGFGGAPGEIPEISFDDGRSQPGPFGFAVRGAATRDGAPLLAHHFSLLDSNTAHKHTALLYHHPAAGLAHATAGWTGCVFGFSGMNQAGLAIAANPCESLNNPLTAEFRRDLFLARLVSSGIPAGILLRMALSQASSVDEALPILQAAPKTFGWCWLLADASGDIALLETTSDIMQDGSGALVIRPGDRDGRGRSLASASGDDLRLHVHFRKNLSDLDLAFLGYSLRPQRYFSNYYFRSVRSHHLLGKEISERLGALDAAAGEEILSRPELRDARDSMNAVVFEPASRRMHFAMGQVPATDGPFLTLDLATEPPEVTP